MIRQACAGNPLTIYGRGEKLRDYIFIEDVTFAFLAAAQQAETLPRGHFVIGTGDGTSIADAFRLVADRVARGGGPAVEVRHVDPPPLSPIEGRDFIADPRKFSSATGWQARVSLADGIDRTVKVLT
jgi:nucleoside-diphosphate-sugar epimerase